MNNTDFKQEQHIICQNILLLRMIHGLTKKKMSQILGISISSLNKIEQGKLPPRLSVSVIFRICEYFGISPFSQSLDSFVVQLMNQISAKMGNGDLLQV